METYVGISKSNGHTVRNGDLAGFRPAGPLQGPKWPWRRNAVLLASDVFALFCCFGAVLLGGYIALGALPANCYLLASAAILLSVLGYAAAGLYAVLPCTPLEEARLLTLVTSGLFGVVTVEGLILFEKPATTVGLLGSAWLLALLAVPIGRAVVRHLFASRRWTGCAVVVLGTGAALAFTRLMESMLYGVDARDPLTFLGVAIVLGAVGFVASYIPASRATRISPVTALKE